MVNAGRPEVKVLDDGWTVVSADGSRAAHFEHTVAITASGPWVLTAEDGGAAARDGGVAARDGGVAARDGRAAAQDGGVVARDGGVVAQDGRAAAQDGGTAAESALEELRRT